MVEQGNGSREMKNGERVQRVRGCVKTQLPSSLVLQIYLVPIDSMSVKAKQLTLLWHVFRIHYSCDNPDTELEFYCFVLNMTSKALASCPHI